MSYWSSLQRQLYNLIDPAIRLQVHCRSYRMASQRGCADIPRYWISLRKEIIWDYPAQFVDAPPHPGRERIGHYPYGSDISAISDLLREYIDTPAKQLLSVRFANDRWGLVNILRAADRRVGVRNWPALKRSTRNVAALKVLAARAESRRNNRASGDAAAPIVSRGA